MLYSHENSLTTMKEAFLYWMFSFRHHRLAHRQLVLHVIVYYNKLFIYVFLKGVHVHPVPLPQNPPRCIKLTRSFANLLIHPPHEVFLLILLLINFGGSTRGLFGAIIACCIRDRPAGLSVHNFQLISCFRGSTQSSPDHLLATTNVSAMQMSFVFNRH